MDRDTAKALAEHCKNTLATELSASGLKLYVPEHPDDEYPRDVLVITDIDCDINRTDSNIRNVIDSANFVVVVGVFESHIKFGLAKNKFSGVWSRKYAYEDPESLDKLEQDIRGALVRYTHESEDYIGT